MNRISTNPYIGFSPSFKPFSLNIKGELFVADRPLVMAIINFTSDSFYSGSRTMDLDDMRSLIKNQIDLGADIIDIGACSTRPGAESINENQEIERIAVLLEEIRRIDQKILVSVDTFRSKVAAFALDNGANIINDISGGKYDDKMFECIACRKAPYILMHSSGNPDETATVSNTSDDITADVIKELSLRVEKAKSAGINDIIIDPGFGFSKTITQNYSLLKDLPLFVEAFQLPLLVGISRKSMLYKPLSITQDSALEATVALDTIALMMGASIVRVHDPLPARQTIDLISLTYRSYLK